MVTSFQETTYEKEAEAEAEAATAAEADAEAALEPLPSKGEMWVEGKGVAADVDWGGLREQWVKVSCLSLSTTPGSNHHDSHFH